MIGPVEISQELGTMENCQHSSGLVLNPIKLPTFALFGSHSTKMGIASSGHPRVVVGVGDVACIFVG